MRHRVHRAGEGPDECRPQPRVLTRRRPRRLPRAGPRRRPALTSTKCSPTRRWTASSSMPRRRSASRRSIYKRKAITATHYAEVKVTVAGDVADYTASVLDTMAEHLAYKMNVAVGNVKITAAAGSVVLSIVVGYLFGVGGLRRRDDEHGDGRQHEGGGDALDAGQVGHRRGRRHRVVGHGLGPAPGPEPRGGGRGGLSRSARSPASPSARRLAASSSPSASASASAAPRRRRRPTRRRRPRKAPGDAVKTAQPRLGESERAVSERMHSGKRTLVPDCDTSEMIKAALKRDMKVPSAQRDPRGARVDQLPRTFDPRMKYVLSVRYVP